MSIHSYNLRNNKVNKPEGWTRAQVLKANNCSRPSCSRYYATLETGKTKTPQVPPQADLTKDKAFNFDVSPIKSPTIENLDDSDWSEINNSNLSDENNNNILELDFSTLSDAHILNLPNIEIDSIIIDLEELNNSNLSDKDNDNFLDSNSTTSELEFVFTLDDLEISDEEFIEKEKKHSAIKELRSEIDRSDVSRLRNTGVDATVIEKSITYKNTHRVGRRILKKNSKTH